MSDLRERVVLLLREMAEAMRGRGDRTRAAAYSQAAEAIAARPDFDALVARKRLQGVTGVGPSIEQKLLAFIERGERPAWLDDEQEMPPRIGGSAASRARAREAGAIPDDVPDAYHTAPFPDAPDLHVHTTWSDGTLRLHDVVVWAKRLGAPAVGIADHSGGLRIAHGLTPERVREQWKEIDRVRLAHPDIAVLRGTECDILRNGRLDHPEDLLAGFDFVVASMHSHLSLDKAAQTARVLAALDSPHVTILGHPTARRIGQRQASKLDLDKIFAKAADRGVALEVNGNPGRLDLDVPLATKALAAGCKLACSSDGHSAHEMMSFAVARLMVHEAGAKKADIVNYDVLAKARAAHLRADVTSR